MIVALRVRKSERGVTLAEVLVSILIIAIVGLALLYGTLMTFHASQMAQINVTAEGLARSALEDIRKMPYNAGHQYPLTVDYSSDADYSLVVTAVQINTNPNTSPFTESVTVTVTYLPSEISKVDLGKGIISFTAPGRQVISITTYMTKE